MARYQPLNQQPPTGKGGPQRTDPMFNESKTNRNNRLAKEDMEKLLKNEKQWTGVEQRRASSYADARQKDLATGKARGEEIFGNQALGRISEGFSPQEQQSMREQNMKAITQSQMAGARDLARSQARSGVRGPLASAQAAQQNLAGQGQLADQERQLFLENIANKRSGQQFNLGQAEKELMGKQATELGYGSLGAGERAAAMQSVIGDKALLGSKDVARISKGKK